MVSELDRRKYMDETFQYKPILRGKKYTKKADRYTVNILLNKKRDEMGLVYIFPVNSLITYELFVFVDKL